MNQTKWPTATRQNPCPKCGKVNRCRIAPDGRAAAPKEGHCQAFERAFDGQDAANPGVHCATTVRCRADVPCGSYRRTSSWLETYETPQGRNEAAIKTFLGDQDESGRWADFHALRHTFITGLVTGGVNPKVAQTLARHSNISLTMDRYTHMYSGNLSEALNVLPDLSAPIARIEAANGTTGKTSTNHLSPDLSLEGEFQRSSMQSGGVKSSGADNQEMEKRFGKTRDTASKRLKPRPRVELGTAGLQNRKHTQATGDPTDSCKSSENCFSADLSLNVINHPELAGIIRLWPNLPLSFKTGIVAMIEALERHKEE